MGRLIINCDLAEHESSEMTNNLLGLIDAANICCGVHAGNTDKTQATISQAKKHNVLIGAHPGLASAGGRGAVDVSVDDFQSIISEQINDFMDTCASLDATMHHVKLHGSLYNHVETDQRFADAYIQLIKRLPGKVKVFCLANGAFSKIARNRGLSICHELFADRNYNADGTLRARTLEHATIKDIDQAIRRIRKWNKTGGWMTYEGDRIKLSGDTLCVHSDTPNALPMLHAIRSLIDKQVSH